MDSVCRICLKTGALVSMINTIEQSLNVKISVMVARCLEIEISGDSDLPSNICVRCLGDVKVAYQLRLTSEESESILSYNVQENEEAKYETTIIYERADDEQGQETPFEPDPGTVCLRTLSPEEAEGSEIDEIILEVADSTLEVIKYATEIKDQTDGDSDEVEEKWMEFEGESDDETEKGWIYDERVKKESLKTEPNETTTPKLLTKGLKGFSCSLCGDVLQSKATLISHMNRHNNEKNFKCGFCDKRFVNNQEMKRHERTHTGEKRYACKFCDKMFTDFSVMKRHQRTHTGYKPYVCQVCLKSFTYSSVLNKHMTVHTRAKNYECNLCFKKFAHNHHLKQHLKAHSNGVQTPEEQPTKRSRKKFTLIAN